MRRWIHDSITGSRPIFQTARRDSCGRYFVARAEVLAKRGVVVVDDIRLGLPDDPKSP